MLGRPRAAAGLRPLPLPLLLAALARVSPVGSEAAMRLPRRRAAAPLGRRRPGGGGPTWFNAEENGTDEEACPEDHIHLLSRATTCCYQKIVKDPDCCMDKEIAPGPQRRSLQRPGMVWHCNNDNCYDAVNGTRGQDVLWVPPGATCESPRILYTHGGSWMYGSPDTDSYAQLASRLAASTGAVVMLTDYPLVPAGNYSTIMAWTVSALQWLATHGPYDHCSPRDRAPLFVGGDSSGGGTTMSLVLELQARPELLPRHKISGAFLYSPWTNLMCNTPEYYTNAFAKIDSKGRFKDLTVEELYVGDILFQDITSLNSDAFSGNALQYAGNDRELQTDPIASPYFAAEAQFSGEDMPPLYFAVGGSESIMGDSVHVAQAAARGGAKVQLEIFSGMWHVFPMYSEGCGSGEKLWSAEEAIENTGLFVRHIAAHGRPPFAVEVAGPLEMAGAVPSSGAKGGDATGRSRSTVPHVRYRYDPRVDRFDKVGELLPHRVSGYKDFMHQIASASPWIVLPAVGSGFLSVFILGFCAGGLVEFTGFKTAKRVKRVVQYRRRMTQARDDLAEPLRADSATAQGQPKKLDRRRSFMADFVMGVPEGGLEVAH